MSADMSWRWSEDNIAEVTREIKAAIKRGLLLAGEHILNVSNSQVPHEDGDLERTGTVTSADGDEQIVAISYDTPYAARQHEDLTLRHDSGRNAKFLANACKSESAVAGKIVATSVRKVVGS